MKHQVQTTGSRTALIVNHKTILHAAKCNHLVNYCKKNLRRVRTYPKNAIDPGGKTHVAEFGYMYLDGLPDSVKFWFGEDRSPLRNVSTYYLDHESEPIPLVVHFDLNRFRGKQREKSKEGFIKVMEDNKLQLLECHRQHINAI